MTKNNDNYGLTLQLSKILSGNVLKILWTKNFKITQIKFNLSQIQQFLSYVIFDLGTLNNFYFNNGYLHHKLR